MFASVEKKLKFLNDKKYRDNRLKEPLDVTERLKDASVGSETALLFKIACDREQPVLYDDDLFGFNRLHAILPNDQHEDKIPGANCFSGNMTFDYKRFIAGGINGLRKRIDNNYDKNPQGKEMYDCMRMCFDSMERIVKDYQINAEKTGNFELAKALKQVPLNGARDYYEACICVKFLSFVMRLGGIDHVTLGRFDQYMKPYFDQSVNNGQTLDELLEITELFFIAMNIDTDIFHGIQKGDNGQSMVLGGIDISGNDIFSDLSEICLKASQELKLIDPKINLRVNKNTPLSFYERGTQLTKQGLGFPQYSNDDVIIPFMESLGYEHEDAVDYAVAACWEVIPSGCGADIPNSETMNFPLMVEKAINGYLLQANTFEDLLEGVKEEIIKEANRMMKWRSSVDYMPHALVSAFVYPCIERGLDHFYGGAKYHNYGIHGAGISVAADSLAAVKLKVFMEKSISKETLMEALNRDYEGYESLRKELASCPKMGNNDNFVDDIASILMDAFAEAVNNKPNGKHGVYRAGTGSAMEYILSAERVGATPDGRKAKQPYASSFSPSIEARIHGPLSAVQTFTKYDLKKIANGGPFTIELHDTVFRNPEGEKKVAMLVKTFIDLGGHQIQLNAINRDILLDAQKNPDNYPNLIVRVWGWSGYFCELETKYQNHIISRCEFTF